MTVEFSALHKILKDPTRREILKCLNDKGPLPYVELMEFAKVTNTGRFNYHLKMLSGLIEKQGDGKYSLTERGRLAVQLLDEFPEKTVRTRDRMNKKIIAISVLIAILVVGAFAGTIFYYNGEIANQNSQISNLKSQLTNVTGQLTNLTSANIVTSLTVTEVPYYYNNYTARELLNYLWIYGGVTDTGRGTAYNAGLHVVAFTANGTLEINMTVPLGVGGYGYGVDNSTNALGTTYTPNFEGLPGWPATPTTTVYTGLIHAICAIAIYHEGTVTNWTVTPVWTNSP